MALLVAKREMKELKCWSRKTPSTLLFLQEVAVSPGRWGGKIAGKVISDAGAGWKGETVITVSTIVRMSDGTFCPHQHRSFSRVATCRVVVIGRICLPTQLNSSRSQMLCNIKEKLDE